jgi:hypothetical protein
VSGVRVMIGRLRSAKVNHAVTFSAHSQFISLTCKTGYPLITGDSFSLATGPRPHEPGRKLLSRVDRDLDCRIRPKVVAVLSMKFRVPMRNPSPDFTDKVKTAFFSQVSEIANQVCDGMLVTGAAVPLINRDGLGGPGNVVGFIGHALSFGALSPTFVTS